MNRRALEILKAAAGAAVLIATVAWLSGGCGERIGPDDATEGGHARHHTGASATVVEEQSQLFEVASGTVLSARHATVSSKILARIDSIPVRAGDHVAEGDIVVGLDNRDLEARLQAARENVAGAEAAEELARSEVRRISELHRSKVAAQQQVDRMTAALRVAEAKLEGSRQKLADARVALSYSEIRSPVSGRVIDRLAEPGDTAAPGAPLLRIYDPGSMRLEAPVRERLATRLAPGEPLAVSIEAIDLDLTGTIDEIVPAAEPGARTFLVKIRLPEDPRLFSGMFGRVRIPAGQGNRLMLPVQAVERIGQLEFVDVISEDGALRRRLITTQAVDSDTEGGESSRVEVSSGLAAGENVALY
jgi:membrane fusion protein (multidrug efflux system)